MQIFSQIVRLLEVWFCFFYFYNKESVEKERLFCQMF